MLPLHNTNGFFRSGKTRPDANYFASYIKEARGEIKHSEGLGRKISFLVIEFLTAAAQPTPGISAAGIGIIIALFGASGVFGQLEDALNTIWSVKPKPGAGILAFIRARFLSFVMVAGVCFLLLVSLTVEGILKGLHG
jgi:membrane protein